MAWWNDWKMPTLGIPDHVQMHYLENIEDAPTNMYSKENMAKNMLDAYIDETNAGVLVALVGDGSKYVLPDHLQYDPNC